MINLNNLHRQHRTINEEVSLIENEVSKGKAGWNVEETVLHINRLAGYLKIHLMEEDDYLYPDLLQCNDNEVETMAQQYINEMGDLAEAYTKYKNAYNRSSKIYNNPEQFMIDTTKTMNALKERIEKEDHGLYNTINLRKL